MHDRREWQSVMIRAIAVFVIVAPSFAADRPQGTAGRRPPVDQVDVRGGPKLRGMLFAQGEDKSVTLLVSANWLKGANADWFATQHRKSLDAHSLALEQVVERLKKELAVEHPAAFTAFLKQQLEDVESELDKADKFDPELIWINLTGRDVERIEPASTERRQLLAWAWNEGLDRPETRDADHLQKELKDRAIEPASWPLSFVERLPAREQTDDEWAARMAIVEYALGKRLDFQGTGDVLARAGRDTPAEVGPLLIEMLRQQLQSQFGDLLGEAKPNKKTPADNPARTESLKKAIQTAESEQRTGFRVTRLELASDFQHANVTTQFVARLANGSWRTIFQHVARADAKQARPEIEKRIQDDPQIKRVLELTRQLGLTAEEQIQQAIRFGAATMTAQQSCDREFAAFRDIYLSSLAKPPLTVPGER